MNEKSKVSYEQVEQAASEMIANGVKPTVRAVINVTGGKTEKVSGFLRDFFEKRDADVSRMSDEIGSSRIAMLLATEMQMVVDRRTASLSEIIARQKEQIKELVELLDEKEFEAKNRIREAEDQIVKIKEKAEASEKRAKEFEKSSAAAEESARRTVETTEQKYAVLIESTKKEAQALVDNANKRIEKSESECVSLREQVKSLSIDAAKREIEQAQFETAQQQLEAQRQEIADYKASIIQTKTENSNNEREIKRLMGDLKEFREQTINVGKMQSQLVETHKKVSQLQHDLSQSERERESLRQALSSQK